MVCVNTWLMKLHLKLGCESKSFTMPVFTPSGLRGVFTPSGLPGRVHTFIPGDVFPTSHCWWDCHSSGVGM